jgi:hypothetical protein
MTILASVRERETRRIREASRCAVDNFGNQRKRLKSPRPEILQKKKFRKVVKITFVGDCEHGAKPLQIDVIGADFMMTRQAQVARGA